MAIVAHEIGHYKKAHILKGLAISIVQSGTVFVLLSIFLKSEGLFDAFYVKDKSIYAGLVFFGMLFSPIDLALSFFVQGLHALRIGHPQSIGSVAPNPAEDDTDARMDEGRASVDHPLAGLRQRDCNLSPQRKCEK